jgi:hypothetical protein
VYDSGCAFDDRCRFRSWTSAKPLVFPHFGASVAACSVALGESLSVDPDTLARTIDKTFLSLPSSTSRTARLLRRLNREEISLDLGELLGRR